MRLEQQQAAIEIAISQLGMISRRQAAQLGIAPHAIRRLVNQGHWAAILPGVFEIPTAGNPDRWRQLAQAAVLWAGDGTLSFRTAGALLGILKISPGHIDVTLSRKSTSPADWLILHAADLPRSERVRVEHLPVTSAARTLLDLARVLDRGQLELCLDAALARGHRANKIGRVLDGEGRRSVGAGMLAQLLDERRGVKGSVESELETLFLRACRRGRLPMPIPQFHVSDGRFSAYIDFAFPERRLGIECDSVEFHAGARAWRQDLHRQNRLVSLGWRILRVTWRQLKEDPQGVVGLIRANYDSLDPYSAKQDPDPGNLDTRQPRQGVQFHGHSVRSARKSLL